ncbi:hypothetical protein K5B08_00845, partial [Candidatus Carsonella ruddii]|nr:hypothetical protein [Candidatus Carsonella ruddii]
ILTQIINLIFSKKNEHPINNYEQLFLNNIIINQNNDFLYKKFFFKNIYFKVNHKKNKYPFLISLFFFIFSFSIIWYIWYLSIISFVLIIINILFFIYE